MIASFLMVATLAQTPEQSPLPRYERANCVFERGDWAAAANLECGTLLVHENPERREGRVLELPVAVLKAKRPGDTPPLVMLQGGPGEGPGLLADMTRGVALAGFSESRDIVLYVQRGAGEARPVLCPDWGIDHYDVIGERERSAFRAAVRECVESIRRDGGDPAMYNTRNSAADLAALRRALGYPRWDVWSESYGGRLALESMRVDPAGIRSVVLERPTPHGPWRAEVAKNRSDALARVFESCAADARCAGEFPAPDRDLLALFERLEQSPFVIDSTGSRNRAMQLDGHAFVHALVRLARRPSTIAWIPFLLDQLMRGEVERAAHELIARAGNADAAPGRVTFWLVECYDQYGLGFEELQDSVDASVPAPFRASRPLECDLWQDRYASQAEVRPVSSAIPTLIMTGRFDPITPPAYGGRIAATLTNAHVYELPSESHHTREVTPCHVTIRNRFWADPARAPDGACVANVAPIEFVIRWPSADAR
jgi:pimeloyl-ACP methyl ester carboxylesterase